MRHMSYFFSSKEYRYFSVSSFYEKFGFICHEKNNTDMSGKSSSRLLSPWQAVFFLEDFQMVTIDMEKTGKRIKEIRKRSGMTIRQVQEACGISAAAVCKWQNGQAMPTLDNLIILADLWDVKMDDLIVRQVS